MMDIIYKKKEIQFFTDDAMTFKINNVIYTSIKSNSPSSLNVHA